MSVTMPNQRRPRDPYAAGRWLVTALAVLIVLSPLRARLGLEDRSQGPIYGEYVDFVLLLMLGIALAYAMPARGRRVAATPG